MAGKSEKQALRARKCDFYAYFAVFYALQTPKYLKNDEKPGEQSGAGYVAQGAPSPDP